MDLWIFIFVVIITIGDFIREYGVVLFLSIIIRQQFQINNLINKQSNQ